MEKPLRVTWLGLRGFPNVQGGIEAHAENQCPLLSDMGCDVTVIVRRRYQPKEVGQVWRGVRFVPLWSPHSKHLETIVHSVVGVLWSAVHRPDVLHIHGVGPSLVVPLARLLGLRVVVTHHGADYEREKWGKLARFSLELGERLGMNFAQHRIVISHVIQKLMYEKYGVNAALIPNGVPRSIVPPGTDALNNLGLAPRRYILMVSRLVPEKRHLDLIKAFERAALPDWKLVIVGSSDTPGGYEREVRDLASGQPNTICAGMMTGEALKELYAHAGVFVLPSSHEGLSITLLEAMSYGVPIIASAIPANLCLQTAQINYFPLGDIESLAVLLRRRAVRGVSDDEGARARRHVRRGYNWPDLARRTHGVYRKAVYGEQVRDSEAVFFPGHRLLKGEK